ncbi:MFS transporter [Aneurinibacillus sp. Ricciae_BoGa-3]|uniref:MFS transporter n=1 Tax=Aneurinibacillus sp. Ricciae_BoGa-3 TaxID=3022697 RepID=UPI00234112CA|nr:MFS transporter [Aneurinibacillus sp. Ricciae_BoGa-3]WCK56444.1 MFS transporter [Aneurinibacillus sp. Ricciae_BoGa-3]
MPDVTTPIAAQTIKKVTKRIIPFIFLLYIVAFLDRANLGYAALDMNKALGLTSEVFGIVSGIFFLGYFLFEVPSNMLLYRTGARKWIARILVSWGIVVIITAFSKNVAHLYILRFILGAAEAGFFPGLILYMTYWFPAKERARAIALFMTAIACSYIIGAPVSTLIMDHIHWLGMPGWRWLFILEGLPAVLLGIVTYFYLTDRPDHAKWLTQPEKDWLKLTLQQEQETKSKLKQHSTREVLKNPRVWYLSLIYFAFNIGAYGVGFWLPQIIKSLSKLLTNTEVGLLTAIPYVAGAIAMIFWSRRSDRLGERRIHAAVPLLIGALGLMGSGMTTNPGIAIAMMAVAVAGMYSFYGPFWSLSTQYLTESAAAVGIAFINSVGNLSGFLGPYVIGIIKDATGNVKLALFFLSAALVVCSVLLFAMRNKQTPQSLDNSSYANVK